MARDPNHLRRRAVARALAVATSVAAACGLAAAQEQPPATRPAYPALEQLNRESIALHERLQGSVLRVQVPAAPWVLRATAGDLPLDKKYPNLTPEVRDALNRRQTRGGTAGDPAGNNLVANQSAAGNTAAPATTRPAGDNTASALADNGFPRARPDGRPAAPPQSVPQRAASAPRHPLQQNTAGPAPTGTANLPQTFDLAEPGRGQRYTILVPHLQNAVVNDAQAFQQIAPDNGRSAGGGGGGGNPPPAFAPNSIGLLLNARGHVLVPAYVGPEAVGGQPVRLAVALDADPVEARFVGSDEQTQLTVLQCAPPGERPNVAAKTTAAADVRPAGPTPAAKDAAAGEPAILGLGRPVVLARQRPADGTVVLMLSPADGSGRLAVWTGNGLARESGVVVTIDGEVAGIARGGQFLSGSACQLIADQIIRHGAVRRATLGVIITQVDAADPDRQRVAELGDRPAVRVDQVMAGSPADRAGLRAGDLILALAGEPVNDIPSLAAAVAARSGPTELTVLRDGKAVGATVDLVRK